MSTTKYAAALYMAIAGMGVAIPTNVEASPHDSASPATRDRGELSEVVYVSGLQLLDHAAEGLQGDMVAGLLTCSSNCNNNNHNNNNNNNTNNNNNGGGGGRIQSDDPELTSDLEDEYLV